MTGRERMLIALNNGDDTEYLIKDDRDFEIWNEYSPLPSDIDFTNIRAAAARLGDRGIIRSHPFSPGQGSPWQASV